MAIHGYHKGWLFTLLVLAGCAGIPVSDEELASKAEIRAVKLVVIVSVDGNPFVGLRSTKVNPGTHRVDLGKVTVTCETKAGHIYNVAHNGCFDVGLNEAAQRIKSRQDAEQLEIDKAKYQEYKLALQSPQNEAYLLRMKSDLQSKRPGFNNDPDNLLAIVNQQLAPYIEEENARKAAEAANRNAEMIRLAKEKETRIVAWRKNLKIGDEVWCGPLEAERRLGVDIGTFYKRGLVVDLRGPIAEVQYDGSTSKSLVFGGSKEWTRIDELAPSPD